MSQTVFAIFPVCGLRQLDSERLMFSVKSFPFIYSMIIQVCIAFMFSTSIYKQLNGKIEYTKVGKLSSFLDFLRITIIPFLLLLLHTVKFVFFFLNFLVYVNFTIVARKWPLFVRRWEHAESKLFELQIMQQRDQQVRRKIWRIAIVIMLLAFGEREMIFFLGTLWKMKHKNI